MTGYVQRHLGARLRDAGGARPAGSLVELAIRRNPRRAQLLVSPVLGKHIPADPREVRAAGRQLGDRVAAVLPLGPAPLVIGYAETATALGHLVAHRLNAPYLHTTRRSVAGYTSLVEFDEEHSHAARHRLLPESADMLDHAGPVVLVDDELSTGQTALNTIAALQHRHRHEHYVIATLLDVRAAADERRVDALAQRLGVPITVVALSRAELELPDGFAKTAAGLAGSIPQIAAEADRPVPAPICWRGWPSTTREGGRHGFGPADQVAAELAASDVARQLAPALSGAADVLVLGTEELMYAPLLIADALDHILAETQPSARVRISSTTRSPIVVLDEPGYPIRSVLTFAAHDGTDESSMRFAYNVSSAQRPFGAIVVVVDEVGDTPALRGAGGLLGALSGTGADLHLVTVPAYRPVAAAAPVLAGGVR